MEEERNQEGSHDSDVITIYSHRSHVKPEIAVLKTTFIMIAIYSLTLRKKII